jgi:hypothetical protein
MGLVVVPAALVPGGIGLLVTLPVSDVGRAGIGGDPDPGAAHPVKRLADVRVVDHVAVVQKWLVAVLHRRAIDRAIGANRRGYAAGCCQRHEGEKGHSR